MEQEVTSALSHASSLDKLEEVFRAYLGRKGKITFHLRELSHLSPNERVKQGKALNNLRDKIKELYEEQKLKLQKQEGEEGEWTDVTVPGKRLPTGHMHPLSRIQMQAQEIFHGMGFAVAHGPEIETEWYNFDALNMPVDHPARDMQDTFWLKGELDKQKPENKKSGRLLLRTHTSPVQVRYMEKNTPPFRIIAPGRAFRHEATDARHDANMHQLEGLMVGKDVSVTNMKAVLEEFFRLFFGEGVTARLRPSYFPFVEPGFEVDMSCVICKGRGYVLSESKHCSTCGQAGWIEMMGAGMVHQNVFTAAGYKQGDWQGFAFGMGLDRLAMMKYQIHDIRLLYSGDLSLLDQF